MFDNKQFILAVKDTIEDFLSDDSITYEEKKELVTVVLQCCIDNFIL